MDEWSNICSSFLFVGNTSAYRYNISKERSKIVMIIMIQRRKPRPFARTRVGVSRAMII